MSFLITQFSAGDQSYLPVAQLALSVNDEMERRGKERYRILVPWVHGEQQRRIMVNAFRTEEESHPREILLDERLGRIILPFLSNEAGYAASVAMWVAGWEDAGRAVRAHFNDDVTAFDLAGRPVAIGQPNIALEINRTPRFHFGVALAYQVTNCRLSQLFKSMGTVSTGPFGLGRELLVSAQKAAEEIERNLCRTFVCVPGTFTSPEILPMRSLDNELIAPYMRIPPEEVSEIPLNSVYITVSNGSNLNTKLRSALTWGVPVFTNNPERLGGGLEASTGILRNKNIKFHFAHGTWDAITLSLMLEKPLLVPPFDSLDDPEIYFNIKNATQWGLAHVTQGESLEGLRVNLDKLQSHQKTIHKNIHTRFGTEIGPAGAARRIVEDLLKEPRLAYD